MGSVLECIEPNQLALLTSLFAIAISEGLTPNEIFSLGSFIAAVGDTMLSIGSQQILLGADPEKVYCPSKI